jgi:hypothetical protein
LVWSAPIAAQGQPPTGALPPVEPAPQPPPTEPAPPPPEGAAPAQPEAQPEAQPQPQPPPPQTPPPGYGYPPPGYAYPPPEPIPPKAPDPEPTRNVSLTMSPLHLFLPVFEAMVELRVVDGFGVSVIGGYGQVTAEDNLGTEHEFSALELGGQLIWYPLEPFRSLQLGAEILYIKVETQDEGDQATLTGVGDGVAMGPLVGYKLVTSGGFTFLAQGGFQYVAIRAEASDGAGTTASDEQDSIIPLINLNLGWTF